MRFLLVVSLFASSADAACIGINCDRYFIKDVPMGIISGASYLEEDLEPTFQYPRITMDIDYIAYLSSGVPTGVGELWVTYSNDWAQFEQDDMFPLHVYESRRRPFLATIGEDIQSELHSLTVGTVPFSRNYLNGLSVAQFQPKNTLNYTFTNPVFERHLLGLTIERDIDDLALGWERAGTDVLIHGVAHRRQMPYDFLDLHHVDRLIEPGETDPLIDTKQLNISLRRAIPGDANDDFRVDFKDFLVVAVNFNKELPSIPLGSGFAGQGDFNYDGQTNISDFLILANNFGKSEPIGHFVPIPEPSGFNHCQILTAFIPLLYRRRSHRGLRSGWYLQRPSTSRKEFCGRLQRTVSTSDRNSKTILSASDSFGINWFGCVDRQAMRLCVEVLILLSVLSTVCMAQTRYQIEYEQPAVARFTGLLESSDIQEVPVTTSWTVVYTVDRRLTVEGMNVDVEGAKSFLFADVEVAGSNNRESKSFCSFARLPVPDLALQYSLKLNGELSKQAETSTRRISCGINDFNDSLISHQNDGSTRITQGYTWLFESADGFRPINLDYRPGRLEGLPTREILSGDANHDYQVDFKDFLVLANNFGTQGDWWGGDFTGDRQVGFNDFIKLANNFGESSPAVVTAAPEPATFVAALSAMTLAVLLRRELGRSP